MTEIRSHKSDQITSFGSRLGDTLLKLCMLITVSLQSKDQTYLITPEVFASASIITDYLKESYINLLSEVTVDQFDADQKRLLKFLKKCKGRASKSKIMQDLHFKGSYIEELANDLSQKGMVDSATIKTASKPRLEYYLLEAHEYDAKNLRLLAVEDADLELEDL